MGYEKVPDCKSMTSGKGETTVWHRVSQTGLEDNRNKTSNHAAEQTESVSKKRQAETFEYFFSTKGVLPAAAAPPWTVRPYIHHGYRDVSTWRQIFLSLFQWHNETGNIWTHIVGLLLFLALFVRELSMTDKDMQHKAVAFFYISITIFCMSSSAFFHLAMPRSAAAYDVTLRIDMTGIVLVIIVSFGVGLHYGYWCFRHLEWIYLGITSVLSAVALLMPHMSTLVKNNFNLVVAFFSLFVCFSLVPLFHWVSLVGGFTSEEAKLFFYKLIITFGLYAAGGVFYAMQFPERMYAGRFDIIGHSHQIWHALVLAGSIMFYTSMQEYWMYRIEHPCPA